MALTIFLFKVSNLDLGLGENNDEYNDAPTTDVPTVRFIPDELIPLLCAKTSFRGIHLWSNNVRVRNSTANFVARGNKPKKFNFNIASGLATDDKLRIEFFTLSAKKKRHKLVGYFDVILESLINSKYIDLAEENLFDPENNLIAATVQLKLYYTPPDIEDQIAAQGFEQSNVLVDWKSTFDDQGRHGGHRYRHIHSRSDTGFKKFRTQFVGRRDDADTDSYSDSDFNENQFLDKEAELQAENEKKKRETHNIELLEKSLGRYTGDLYELTEWQVMVHIVQARDLVGLAINPYVIVQIADQKQKTTTIKSSNSPYFDQYFTFDFTLPATLFMEKVIFIKVHSEKKIISTFMDTKPIGIFRVDISTVYNEREHAFERKWAPLVDPDNVGASSGHLLVSISITQRGVPSKNIVSEVGQEDDEFNPAKVLLPSSMPRNVFPIQIKIILYGASDLPSMMTEFLASVSKKIFPSDNWEPVDSYIEVSYSTFKDRTESRNGLTPVWGEALYLVGRFPPLVRTMRITLKDHSSVQKDRVISSIFIDLFQISETNPSTVFLPTLGPTWIFLYGSPREYKMSKDQDGLSEGMGESVSYKGRLLMAIECQPVTDESSTTSSIQKETGIQFPAGHVFPIKRNFLLFGCIYDVSMIDKAFGNSTICFELSIGPSGYSNPNELAVAPLKPISSLTRLYPRIPIDNNQDHFRLPIDLQKPIMFTKYNFHDYVYRMTLCNRLKHAAEYLSKLIHNFETKINGKESREVLVEEYKKIEDYVYDLPCGCGEQKRKTGTSEASPPVHPNLAESLETFASSIKMNTLDIKRRKKLAHYLESIKSWISKTAEFDESKRSDAVKELKKIANVFQRMAIDAQPALPDIFLWMICDTKRVAYARFAPEDLLFNLCEGDKGLKCGSVQTIFLKTPRSTNQPLNPSTNAKVQIFLWLGIEEHERFIYKLLPPGYEMPPVPISTDQRYIRYTSRMHFELRCHCYKARALIAADQTGLSDPFLSITVGNETQTTPVIKQTLCPQWNVTLAFRNLIHVGTLDTAEDIIGQVVVECYDFDEPSLLLKPIDDATPELIGRFSTSAILDLNTEDISSSRSLFKWYEFKIGDKQTGELLALFELVEINPETGKAETSSDLRKIPLTTEYYPKDYFVIECMKNEIYEIPEYLMPKARTYEIEIMFWGLREFRAANLLNTFPVQQTTVTVECSGRRISKTIKSLQKRPNFESLSKETDIDRIRVKLPDDQDWWPYLSILCVQKNVFGKDEIIGNLVVTNLQKYIESPIFSDLPTNNTDDVVKKLIGQVSYDFNRVRRSLFDAYYAALAEESDDLRKKKLQEFESKAGDNENDEQQGNEHGAEEHETAGQPGADGNNANQGILSLQLMPLKDEKARQHSLEKIAGWWHKYYASKAKLKLKQLTSMDPDDHLEDGNDAYTNLIEESKGFTTENRKTLLDHLREVLKSAEKAHKNVRDFAQRRIDLVMRDTGTDPTFDQSLEKIEIDRLQELALLQTFEIFDKELENVDEYEGFSDCVESFPLYKGKGSSRSDQDGNENRVHIKFKGKFRIRPLELPITTEEAGANGTTDNNNVRRKSMSASLFNRLNAKRTSLSDAITKTHQHMLKFNYNEHPITLKCRLYIIKATLYRGWDQSGKADPYIKIAVNDTTIVNDIEGKLQNTLEPVFGKSFEFDVRLPFQNLIRIQLWDWDSTSSDDLIAETKIDVENRWFSCHRATCGLAKRYDSSGYNVWRDTKKPTKILEESCQTAGFGLPVYHPNGQSVTIDGEKFECDPDCVEFIKQKKPSETLHRKAHHESGDDYIKENTALGVLNLWSERINPRHALVPEHIEYRSLYNPERPETEEGKLEMWMDFFPMSRPPSSAMIDITPPKPVKYQLRLTVWNTSDVVLNDENFLTGERTSDIYVKAWILGENIDAQQTDIHYRSVTGEGNFNWRFVYDFQYLDIEQKIVFENKDSVFQIGNTVKKIPPKIVVRVYDADFFSADDFLGECILNLTSLKFGAKTSRKCKPDVLFDPKREGINLFVKKRIAGWWPMIAPLKKDEVRDEPEIGGKLEAEFSLLTAEEALLNAVGKAREAPQPLDEPNRPKNSFLWFLSPWKTFRYIIWRNFKGTFCLAIFIFLLLLCLALALWTLPTEIVKQITAKVFAG